MTETKSSTHTDPHAHAAAEPPKAAAEGKPQPPAKLKLILDALAAQDDVSYYKLRDSAKDAFPGFESTFDFLCAWIWGFPRPRVHNVPAGNPWGYAPGPECNQGANLGKLPPDLTDGQIAMLNARTKDAQGKCPTLEELTSKAEKADKAAADKAAADKHAAEKK